MTASPSLLPPCSLRSGTLVLSAVWPLLLLLLPPRIPAAWMINRSSCTRHTSKSPTSSGGWRPPRPWSRRSCASTPLVRSSPSGRDDDDDAHPIAEKNTSLASSRSSRSSSWMEDDMLVSTTRSLDQAIQVWAQRWAEKTTAEIQQDLVRQGLTWTCPFDVSGLATATPPRALSDTFKYNQTERLLIRGSPQQVPGCLAAAWVQVDLLRGPSPLSSATTKDDDLVVVHIEGTADAWLSRGLLALVASTLRGQSVSAILSLVPSEVAACWGLAKALSPGRHDGVASMVRTIQQQIHILLPQVLEQQQVQQQGHPTPTPQLPLASPLTVITPTTNVVMMEDNKGGSLPFEDATSNVVVDKNTHVKPTGPTVALLLSGGVDSSVALRLLQDQGYQVTAFYLKIWLQDELAHLGQCPWEDDVRLCQEVCQQAGVPLETVSLQQAYHQRVIAYTVEEAQQGRTPNPDIMCNRRIKFGCFYDAIATRDFDYVASGHYAQLQKDPHSGVMRLYRAPDAIKDQSYFLCTLTQEQVQRILFPIGHLQKHQVRDLAETYQLPNRHRPDSQGLCFLGKVKFDEFLASYLGDRPGPIVDAATGDLLGHHKGLWYHTVGQRKGIGKGLNPLATSRGPWYVVAKDPSQNTVFCSNEYDQDLFAEARSEFTVESISWIAGTAPDQLDAAPLLMKIRHGPRLVSGRLTLTHDESVGEVSLQQKDSGLAPGQYVVFYQGEECLGAGVISEKHWTKFLSYRSDAASGVVASSTD